MKKPWMWLGLGLVCAGLLVTIYLKNRRSPAPVKLAARIAPTAKQEQTSNKKLVDTNSSKSDELTMELKESRMLLKQKSKMREELLKNPHGTPETIMKAGEALGRIEELEVKYPNRKDEFRSYYHECFNSNETMSVTRVQCLRRFIRIADLNEKETARLVAGLPNSVQRLYRRSNSIP